MGEPPGDRARRPFLRRLGGLRRGRADAAGDFLDRVSGRLHARDRPEGPRSHLGAQQGRDRARAEKRRHLPAGAPGQDLERERKGPSLGGRETNRAADRCLAQADRALRGTRPRREEDLYPGGGLRESELRPLLCEDKSRSVLAHLRGRVRPRRDDRHARAADGDTSGGGVSSQAFAGAKAFFLMRASAAASATPTTHTALVARKPQVKAPAVSFTTPSA